MKKIIKWVFLMTLITQTSIGLALETTKLVGTVPKSIEATAPVWSGDKSEFPQKIYEIQYLVITNIKEADYKNKSQALDLKNYGWTGVKGRLELLSFNKKTGEFIFKFDANIKTLRSNVIEPDIREKPVNGKVFINKDNTVRGKIIMSSNNIALEALPNSAYTLEYENQKNIILKLKNNPSVVILLTH